MNVFFFFCCSDLIQCQIMVVPCLQHDSRWRWTSRSVSVLVSASPVQISNQMRKHEDDWPLYFPGDTMKIWVSGLNEFARV